MRSETGPCMVVTVNSNVYATLLVCIKMFHSRWEGQMPVQRPSGGWLSGTRGLILGRLCAKPSRIAELAEAIGITRNAMRAHLGRLEGHGLVRHRTVRGRVGKPAHVYELTGDGESLLSRGYPLALAAILEGAEALDDAAREELIDRAAKALAEDWPRATGALRERAENAAEMFHELGGVMTVSSDRGDLVLRGDCCPLRASSSDHPITCRLMEAVLGRTLQTTVREHCERNRPPHCRFTIGEPPV